MERTLWGPSERDGCVVCTVSAPPMPLPRFLAAIRQVGTDLDAPVQAVRQERVVSPLHVEMAAWHARRAHLDGRGRSDEIAVEFLLYLAGDRQISRAIAAFGVRPETGGPCLLVVLAPRQHAQVDAAVQAAFGTSALPWPDPDGRIVTGAAGSAAAGPAGVRHRGAEDAMAAACVWWSERAALPARSSARDAEDAVLAAMADLAVARL